MCKQVHIALADLLTGRALADLLVITREAYAEAKVEPAHQQAKP